MVSHTFIVTSGIVHLFASTLFLFNLSKHPFVIRLVAITLLQHTDLRLPHYYSKEWRWLKGALCTVDRLVQVFLKNCSKNIYLLSLRVGIMDSSITYSITSETRMWRTICSLQCPTTMLSRPPRL